MTGQPDTRDGWGNPLWVFNLATVEPIEAGGVNPSTIIDQPNSFTLRSTLTNDGPLSGGLVGQVGQIAHYAHRLEDGVVVTLLAPANFTIGVSPYLHTTGPFTTGPGNDLDVGTYMITTTVSFSGGFVFVAGFNQTLLMVK